MNAATYSGNSVTPGAYNQPNFGLPCPTTIFTFGLFLLNRKKGPMALLIIPLAWSLLGFMAAFKFGIWEDTGLIVASLVTVLLWMHRNKKIKKNEK